ncbi:MAG: hypothetical protein WCT32_01065 [Patescibacteria group bacterium]|jgi:hypothetical protein
MTHQDLYKLLQTVQKNVRCPQCGKQYDFEQISIRGIVESVIFLELNCNAHMPLLATVTLTKDPMPKTKKHKAGEKINPNDVLETYQFLKNFSGSLEQIFKKSTQK